MNENNSGQHKHAEQDEDSAIECVEYYSQKESSNPNAEKDYPEREVEAEIKRFFRYVRFGWNNLDFSKRFELAVAVIGLIVVTIYTAYTAKMYTANETAAVAALGASQTAAKQLELTERPWIKVKLGIVSPLTFDIVATNGRIATATVEGTFENLVGQSVALDVLSFMDILPVDSDFSTRTAQARQAQWCDANRHPNPNSLSGSMLFPKDPLIQDFGTGIPMDKVEEARKASPVKGKIAFVLVGCVAYRFSFEEKAAPRHETKFAYRLGTPQGVGVMQPFVEPRGVADKLRLIAIPDGFSAD